MPLFVALAVFAAAFGTVLGFMRGEVERIFLPLTPWLFLAGSVAGPRRGWLTAQATVTVLAAALINHALSQMGVRQVIAPCATGSLREQTPPGSLVVPDQMVDQTHSRSQTCFDEFHGETFHAQFAEPYCHRLRRALLESAVDRDWPAYDGGAMVVIDGPRFSTRAETLWYASAGWALVNMTGHPEAVLARELRICYATLALVTNFSANLIDGPGVNEAEVYRLFEKNIERVRGVLLRAIEHLPDPEGCACGGG